MVIVVWPRPRTKPPLLERFGKTIRDAKKEILDQPLPQRWDELIKRLDAVEARQRERSAH